MTLTNTDRVAPEAEQWEESLWQFGCGLRVSIPGIVQSFDAAKQTVVVQVALQERIFVNGMPTLVTIHPLQDVPVVIPRAGGFSLTLPIQAGDECLLIFADACIDAWWQSGGVQAQIDRRRHDLSDAFAVMGCWSQPRVLPAYSTTSAQLRTDDGNTVVDIAESGVTVTASAVTVNCSGTAKVNGATVDVTGSTTVNISGNNTTKIDGKDFLLHTHSGVTAGGGVSGPVV